MSTDKVRVDVLPSGDVDLKIKRDLYGSRGVRYLGLRLIAAAGRAEALDKIDRVMTDQRGRFIPGSVEYDAVHEAWGALRVAFGYDDNPATGGPGDGRLDAQVASDALYALDNGGVTTEPVLVVGTAAPMCGPHRG